MAKMRKLVIVGSGPAGYAAAVYAARAKLEPIVFAGQKSGGQLMLTTGVENYPGFVEPVLGPDLMTKMREQATKFGAEIIDHDVVHIDLSKRPFVVEAGTHVHSGGEEHVHITHEHDASHTAEETHTTPEHVVAAEAVIIATGAESIPIGVPGEKEYTGRGVSYCAVCDAAFFKGKRVFVVGGGDAAMEDTLALTKFAAKVTILHRREAFRASKIMQERVLSKKEIVDVWWNSEVIEVLGDEQKIIKIKVKNSQSGEVTEHEAEGLFVAIGHRPATEFLGGQVTVNEKGYILTGMNGLSDADGSGGVEKLWLSGYPTMTSVTGVFAGGDNVDYRYRQAVTAAGMGVMTALDAERWLERE